MESAPTAIGHGEAARSAGRHFRLARGMYTANIVAAGVPGLIITAAPAFAEAQMFAAAQDPVTFRMLGAIWLAIGIVSVLGLRDPLRYIGVFAVQAIYKTIWIAAAGIPLWSVRPDAIPYVVGFAVAAIGFAGAFLTATERAAVAS